jgi:hypothetical protein
MAHAAPAYPGAQRRPHRPQPSGPSRELIPNGLPRRAVADRCQVLLAYRVEGAAVRGDREFLGASEISPSVTADWSTSRRLASGPDLVTTRASSSARANHGSRHASRVHSVGRQMRHAPPTCTGRPQLTRNHATLVRADTALLMCAVKVFTGSTMVPHRATRDYARQHQRVSLCNA